MDLRQGTLTTIKIGPFVDKADGVTFKTTLTPVVKLEKNHSAQATRNSATAMTYDAGGKYFCELNATDLNTAGPLCVSAFDATLHLPVWHDHNVLPADVYDEKYGTLQTLQSATTLTARLDAAATATDDLYRGLTLYIATGTGAGQARRITAYNGTTKDATIAQAWVVVPDNSSKYRLLAAASAELLTTQTVAAVIGAVGSVTAPVAITSVDKKNQAAPKYGFKMYDAITKLPIAGKLVTVTRSLDGGAYAAGTLSAVTDIGFGSYTVDWGAGDRNANYILFRATADGCDDTDERIETQP